MAIPPEYSSFPGKCSITGNGTNVLGARRDTIKIYRIQRFYNYLNVCIVEIIAIPNGSGVTLPGVKVVE